MITAQPTTEKHSRTSIRDFVVALALGVAAALLFWFFVSRLVPWCPTGQEIWCLRPVTDHELPSWFVRSRLTFFYSFAWLPAVLSTAAAFSFIRAFHLFSHGARQHGYIRLISGACAGLWLAMIFSVLWPIFTLLSIYLFFMAVLLVLIVAGFIIAVREHPRYDSYTVRLILLNLAVAVIFWGPFLFLFTELVSD